MARPEAGLPPVQVRRFRLDGNTVFSTEALQALLADAVGQRLDPSGLDEVRERINRHYIEAGYLSSGALLDTSWDEMVEHGVVGLRVVEGRVDAVRIRGLERLDPGYVRSRLVRDDEPLNVDRLQERFRLLLADPLFARINSRSRRGERPGSALLDIEVERARSVALDAFVNNHRPPSVGATAVGLHGVVRNLTGQGDALEATLQHAAGGNPLRLAWSIAPRGQGTRAFASYDNSKSSLVEEDLAPIDIRSRSRGGELGLGQTVVDTLARRVDLALSYARRRSESTLLGLPFSFTPGEVDGVSHIGAWRFAQEWTERWTAQALALRSVFSVGRADADPAATSGLDPAQVPARHYRVWTGQLQFVSTTGAGEGGEWRLRGSAQFTPDRLVPLEQLAVGGIATVRGYRENAVLRDRGLVLGAEVRHPLRAGGPEGSRLTLAAFGDLGGGANTGGPWQRLASLGLGLHWQWGAVTAELSWARRLIALDRPTRGNLQDRGLQFQLGWRLL